MLIGESRYGTAQSEVDSIRERHESKPVATQHRNRLLRRVQIAPDNTHLGLLRPERWEVDAAQSSRAVPRPSS